MTSASVNMGNANMGVFNFFACAGITAQASCRSATVPMKAFHPCMAQISAEKSFEGKVKSMQNIHGSSPLTIYATIYPNAIGTTEHGCTNMRRNMKNILNRKLKLGVWLEDNLLGNLSWKKLNLPWQERLSVPLLQTGLPHGFSLHPLGRGFLSAQHLPPILPKVCLTWSCLNTSRQYCLLNQPLLTWAPGCTSCKLLLKRLCLATKILSKPLSKLFLPCHRSVTSLFATFSSDDSIQFCEELPRCLHWMKRLGHPGFGCLQIQYARAVLLGLAQSSWKLHDNAGCWCCFFFAIICREPKALVDKDLWQAIHKATVDGRPVSFTWTKLPNKQQTRPFLSPRFKHISAHKDTCACVP